MFRYATVGLLASASLCSAQGFRQSLPLAGADVLTASGFAVDSAGGVYIADAAHHRAQRISAGRAVTVAGTGTMGFAATVDQPPRLS
jgi:hypothetical protein